jgi:hypothetical protein
MATDIMTFVQTHFLKLFFGLLLLTFLVKPFYFADRVKLDGVKGEVYGTLLGPSTVYAKDYSHEKFLSIKPGMTEQEVIQILGTPLDRFNPYPSFKDSMFTVGLRYAKGSDENAHYRLRIVYLRKGIVTKKRSQFYYVD